MSRDAKTTAPTPVRPTDDWRQLPALNGGIKIGNRHFEGYIRHGFVLVEDIVIRTWGEGHVDAAQRGTQDEGHGRLKEGSFSPVRSGSIEVVEYVDDKGNKHWSVTDGGNRVRAARQDGAPMLPADILEVPDLSEADLLYLANDKDTQKALADVDIYRARLRSSYDNPIKKLDRALVREGIKVKRGTGSEAGVLFASVGRLMQMADPTTKGGQKRPEVSTLKDPRKSKKTTPYLIGEIQIAMRVYKDWQIETEDYTPIAANVAEALTIVVAQVGEDGARRAVSQFRKWYTSRPGNTSPGGPMNLNATGVALMNRFGSALNPRQTPGTNSPGGSQSKAALPWVYGVLAHDFNKFVSRTQFQAIPTWAPASLVKPSERP